MTHEARTPLLIGVKEACRILGVSDETFRQMRRPGQAYAGLKPVTGKKFYRKQLEEILDHFTGIEKQSPSPHREIMDRINRD